MKAFVRFVDSNAFGLSAKTDAETAHAVWLRAGFGPLREAEAERIGAAMHYAFSVAAGCAYAAGARRFPSLRAGAGTLFGAVLWLVGDELAVTLAGLEDARRTPLQSHASALAAHLLYGLAVDAATRS
jgi:uncharacterized membrane protein YagU involved in acid resistance